MKRVIIAIFLVTMVFRCHSQDTSNHPVLDTSKIFNTLSVAMIDSIFGILVIQPPPVTDSLNNNQFN
jgi:hypothetical protein